jgi:hypothetical protein
MLSVIDNFATCVNKLPETLSVMSGINSYIVFLAKVWLSSEFASVHIYVHDC